MYTHNKLGQIQVSFSFSLAVWKISLLSKPLLYIWVTKQDLAVLQVVDIQCGFYIHILVLLMGILPQCVRWAERVKKPLILCVIFFCISCSLYSKVVILFSFVNALSTAIQWEFLASENILENLQRAGINTIR